MLRLLQRRSAVSSAHQYFAPTLRPLCQATSTSEERPAYDTQRQPTYTLPFYGATDDDLSKLSDSTVRKAVKAYGGLIRKTDEAAQLRDRLRKLTNASYRASQLTMEGVVVSDKMNKSVVIASRRPAYSTKLRMPYKKTRRFMAHDEFDLCREGDRVVIRSCRNMSRRKSHVVVQNYGDKMRTTKDDRKIDLDSIP